MNPNLQCLRWHCRVFPQGIGQDGSYCRCTWSCDLWVQPRRRQEQDQSWGTALPHLICRLCNLISGLIRSSVGCQLSQVSADVNFAMNTAPALHNRLLFQWSHAQKTSFRWTGHKKVNAIWGFDHGLNGGQCKRYKDRHYNIGPMPYFKGSSDVLLIYCWGTWCLLPYAQQAWFAMLMLCTLTLVIEKGWAWSAEPVCFPRPVCRSLARAIVRRLTWRAEAGGCSIGWLTWDSDSHPESGRCELQVQSNRDNIPKSEESQWQCPLRLKTIW